jgi:thiol-disulfide isomerase/thioredoxin
LIPTNGRAGKAGIQHEVPLSSEKKLEDSMSKTQSTMVSLGSIAPAFELKDVVTGRAWGRDDVFALSWDEDRPETVGTAASKRTGDGASPRGRHGLLVMFLCVHCPYVKHVEQGLAQIGRDYEGRIAIAAISSNDVDAYPEDSPAEMKKQAERLGFRFPYLYDETQEVARAYDAACTPDFFLFDADMALVYRGQLDDSRPRRGDAGNDIPVTGRDLRAAMDAVIAGKRPDTNQRTSIGCNIKWKQ